MCFMGSLFFYHCIGYYTYLWRRLDSLRQPWYCRRRAAPASSFHVPRDLACWISSSRRPRRHNCRWRRLRQWTFVPGRCFPSRASSWPLRPRRPQSQRLHVRSLRCYTTEKSTGARHHGRQGYCVRITAIVVDGTCSLTITAPSSFLL